MGTDEGHSNLPGGPSDRRFGGLYTSDLEAWKNRQFKRLARLD